MSLRVDLSVNNHQWSPETETSNNQRPKNMELPKQNGQQEKVARPSVSAEELGEVAEHLSQALEVVDRGLEFAVHEDTKRVMVKVINRETDEVIKEIPPERLLDMIARIWDMIGLIVDEKA